jgi:RNA polymerase sigma factor (sigma-70 family)
MKIQVSNPVLRSLLDALAQGGKDPQQKALQSAEKLMQQIDPAKEYPLDFVVFRLTGSRPRVDMFGQTISGRQLLDDLRIWLNHTVSPLVVSTQQQSEPIYTVSQIAQRYSVSTKTIRRWQKRGLVGRTYLFPDGKKRLGFAASSLEQFEARNASLVKQAKEFTLLSKTEKKGIVDAFEEIARQHPSLSRNQIIQKLIFQTGRVRETIRYILADYEQKAADRTLSTPVRKHLTTQDAATLFTLYREGAKFSDLSRQFGRTQAAIYRAITQRWAKELLSRKCEFIPSPEFKLPDAEKDVLSKPLEPLEQTHKGAVLSRPDEQMLFRRYNYLKYLVNSLQAALQSGHAKIRMLKKMDSLLEEAEKIKQYLVEMNMPLVAGIAGKHLKAGAALSELVSEGAVSMMRAVEKFDYTRGYRFSTYASWIIAKDFARKIPVEAARLDRTTASDLSDIRDDMRSELLADAGVVEKARQDLRQVIDNTLDEREKYVVLNHFALDTGVIKKKPKTLKQIGDDLGLSKERIRQLELQAIQKLRHSLSPEQFDLLTG